MGVLNIRDVPEGLIRRVKAQANLDGKTLKEWVCWVLEAQAYDDKDIVEAVGGRELGDGVSSGVREDVEVRKKGRRAKGVGQAQGREASTGSKGVERSGEEDRGKQGEGKAKKLSMEQFLGLSNSEKLRAQREGRAPGR